MSIASNAYLISISRRQQVAQIRGSPIYVVTGVALIPLTSQSDANSAIKQNKESLRLELGSDRAEADEEDTGSSDEERARIDDDLTGDEHHDASLASTSRTESKKAAEGTSIVQDVIGRQGQYGRFAEKWFSRKGWKTEGRRAQGMSQDGLDKAKSQASHPKAVQDASPVLPISETEEVTGWTESGKDTIVKQKSTEDPEDTAAVDITNSLIPKLLRTTKMLLSSRSFFFSYEYDITRRFGTQEGRMGHLPLHKSVDQLVSI